jgi:hypothetical protein
MSSETAAGPRTWGVSACRRVLPPRISYRMSFDQSVPAAPVTMMIRTGKPAKDKAVFAAALMLVPVDGRRTSCWAY